MMIKIASYVLRISAINFESSLFSYKKIVKITIIFLYELELRLLKLEPVS